VCNLNATNMNVAVTARACVKLTVHVAAEPVHAPLHPENTDDAAAVAVNVTLVPWTNSAAQVPPQSIPAGLLTTEPDPKPARETNNVRVLAPESAKAAVTVRASVMPTVHVLEAPEHAPPQPTNDEPTAALAVNVTDVPPANDATHVAPQSIPTGTLVTVPTPEPIRATVNIHCPEPATTVARISSRFDGSKTLLATISVDPTATPRTTPPLVTVATPSSALDHAIAGLAPYCASAVAVNACNSPTTSVMSPESIVTRSTLGSLHDEALNKNTSKQSTTTRNLTITRLQPRTRTRHIP